MSFVLFAGCKYFGYMIGERRCCDSKGRIISDTVRKVRKINSNLIFSAAGDEDMISIVFEYWTKHDNLLFENAVSLLNKNYHLLYNRLMEISNNQKVDKADDIEVNIGLMSCVNDCIMFAHIHLINKNIEIKIIPHSTDDDITFCFLGTGLGNLGKYYNELFKKNNIFSIANLKSIFYRTVKDNLNDDFTINDGLISEALIRKDIYDERKDRPKH